MAVTVEGSCMIPADRQIVWSRLNDPDVLKACISGCETFEKTSDTTFAATARMRFGPLGVSIRGRLELQDIDAPNGCRILAEGAGGLAGFASGTARLDLQAVGHGTVVAYAVEANVGGRVAKLGGRLIEGAAKKMADRFFAAFAAQVAPAKAGIVQGEPR